MSQHQELRPLFGQNGVIILLEQADGRATLDQLLAVNARYPRYARMTPEMIKKALCGLCRKHSITKDAKTGAYAIISNG